MFLDDILDVPLKTEVDFILDLVPGTIHIFIPPYKMSSSELIELKKQLEDLL